METTGQTIKRLKGGIASGAYSGGKLAGAVLFGDEHLPKWQQWLVVAVFTLMAVIGEWIVITGRTTIRRNGPLSR